MKKTTSIKRLTFYTSIGGVFASTHRPDPYVTLCLFEINQIFGRLPSEIYIDYSLRKFKGSEKVEIQPNGFIIVFRLKKYTVTCETSDFLASLKSKVIWVRITASELGFRLDKHSHIAAC